MQQVAQRLSDLPNVIGFEAMNEPSGGYIGCQDLRDRLGRLMLGDCPTPFQSMLLGTDSPAGGDLEAGPPEPEEDGHALAE